MKALKFWTRPAVFVALWMVASAFTLSELATVGPALRSAPPQRPGGVATKRPTPRARAQWISRSEVAP